ncbi:MAG TPA: hypothetical protein VIT45_09650 [Allosphingosinicella sp.]
MKRRTRLLSLAFAALALCAAAPAPDQGPVEGLYVADIMETATALEIQPCGRFRWMFSVGALDLEGEGLWTRRDDGSLVLNSDPPVVPPRFELVGTGRGRGGGLLVRVADEQGRTPYFLDVEAEHADGSRSRADFEEGEHLFPAVRGRPIVAIRLLSGPFDLVSDRYPVSPAAGNVMTFRFIPNQLGRVDFRDLPVRVEPGALSFTWRGTDLRYAREEPPGPEQPNEPAEPAGDR